MMLWRRTGSGAAEVARKRVLHVAQTHKKSDAAEAYGRAELVPLLPAGSPPPGRKPLLHDLEREVLEAYLRQGSLDAAADELKVSHSTVRQRLGGAYRRTRATCIAQLIWWAREELEV